jgi:GNAT superfamily N-acetyltransferase
MSNQILIRTMEPADLRDALDLAATEGWNPGLEDAAAFYAADPDGFFVGELDGRPIAYISAVKYGNRYGFMGLYIVREGYRGKGYGFQMWQHAVNYLGDMVTGLDGVPAQIENYRRDGFLYAYRQMRFRTDGAGMSADNSIAEATPGSMFDQIADYDSSVFGIRRTAFLNKWLQMPQAAVFHTMSDSTVTGYAVVRKCGVGYKIGPLFADDADVAEALLLRCCTSQGPGPYFFDVSDVNRPALALAEKYEMKMEFETARMYKNGKPEFPVEKVYGVTTFELG